MYPPSRIIWIRIFQFKIPYRFVPWDVEETKAVRLAGICIFEEKYRFSIAQFFKLCLPVNYQYGSVPTPRFSASHSKGSDATLCISRRIIIG